MALMVWVTLSTCGLWHIWQRRAALEESCAECEQLATRASHLAGTGSSTTYWTQLVDYPHLEESDLEWLTQAASDPARANWADACLSPLHMKRCEEGVWEGEMPHFLSSEALAHLIASIEGVRLNGIDPIEGRPHLSLLDFACERVDGVWKITQLRCDQRRNKT